MGKYGSMTLLEIWDMISGTSDESPFKHEFTESVLALLRAEMGRTEPLRILDVGAGSGNPSIGLAMSGHQISDGRL